jgi:hypothetical protein
MKRRGLISVAAALLSLILLASPAMAVPWGSGRLTVKVTVGARVDVEIVDRDHIDLRSNAPWRLVAVHDAETATLEGGSTGGARQRITLPENTTAYWVVPR